MASADAIIDYLVLKGPNANGEKPTQLALLKLLFFIEGWANALLGRSVIGDECFQAWRLGPVLPSQRKRLKDFGANPIPSEFADKERAGSIDPELRRVIDEVWRRHAMENPGTLVGLTHLIDSPWHTVRKANGIAWKTDSKVEIPPQTIASYFSDLFEAARKRRADAAIAEHASRTRSEDDELQAMMLAEWEQLSGNGEDRAWVA